MPEVITHKQPAHIFKITIVLAIVFTMLRIIGVLFSNDQPFILPLTFLAMMLCPLVFLQRKERKLVGFSSAPSRYFWAALLYGSLSVTVCYLLGILLFKTSPDNWFITIKNSYLNNRAFRPDANIHLTFLMFTIPAIFFSPLGEEIFFRGFLLRGLEQKFTTQVSTVLESLLFGIIHIVHHGLFFIKGAFQFFPLSGVIWVSLMFTTAMIFSSLRIKSGSIYPAIVAHMVFNLLMNIFIFYLL